MRYKEKMFEIKYKNTEPIANVAKHVLKIKLS